MSTSNLGLNMHTLRAGLPALTGMLNSLAVGGGLYNWQAPAEAAKAFGIIVPESKVSSTPSPIETALIKVHGIRNFASGVSGIGLLLYLHFSDLTQSSPVAATAIRKSIGISLLVGTMVGLGDSMLLAELGQSPGTSTETGTLAKEKSFGHALMAIPIALLGVAWLIS